MTKITSVENLSRYCFNWYPGIVLSVSYVNLKTIKNKNNNHTKTEPTNQKSTNNENNVLVLIEDASISKAKSK